MEMIKVQSSNIESIGYESLSSTLVVEFKSGGTYRYFDIPAHLYHGLMSAISHGKFLDINIIKYGYRYQKIN